MESQEEKIRRIFLKKWRKEMLEDESLAKWLENIDEELHDPESFTNVTDETLCSMVSRWLMYRLPIISIVDKFVQMAIESDPKTRVGWDKNSFEVIGGESDE